MWVAQTVKCTELRLFFLKNKLKNKYNHYNDTVNS